jgi:SAM-dependent methyltransferase
MGIDDDLAEGWLVGLETMAAFDRPWVDAAVAWTLASGARLPDGPVVDVGCGTGGAACAFAHQARDRGVVGLDRDVRLVAQGAVRARTEGVEEVVRWSVGAVGHLPLPAASVALVWAAGVVHHVPDQQGALDEMVGLLGPGGRLVLVEGGLPPRCLPHDIGVGRPGLEARVDAARAGWFADLRDELGGPPLAYGWPAALARAGLIDVRVRSFVAEAGPPLDTSGRRVATMHLARALDDLGDRLDAEDRATLARLLDPSDPAWVGARDDLVVMVAHTVQTGTRP